MIPDEIGRALHDKATRGLDLSREEQTQVNAWYQAQDSAESEALGLANDSVAPDLESQVADVLTRCALLTQRIQELTAENDALRQENDALREHISRPLQPV
jgi:hypothetical protein